MPAALNEPVNLLQRLCEELEYSELLDIANNTPDPYQRMVRNFVNTVMFTDVFAATLIDLGAHSSICRTDAECSDLVSCRFTSLPLLSLVTPRRHSETATSPLTQCSGRRMSASERTGASTTSVSRWNFQ